MYRILTRKGIAAAVLFLLFTGAAGGCAFHKPDSGTKPFETAEETKPAETGKEMKPGENAAETKPAESAGETKTEDAETEGEAAGGKAEDRKKTKDSRKKARHPVKGKTDNGKTGAEEKKPLPTDPSLVFIASDLHYVSPEMTDYGPAFQARLDRDDGKDLSEIDAVLDSFVDETLLKRPAAVLLSGDLAMDGETENHRKLTEKLTRLTEDGIQVLVLPGNHDIGADFWASSYQGDETQPADTPMNREEYLKLYHQFGFDDAEERDPASLSYLKKLDDKHWFLMLDSAIYENGSEVGGRLRPETLAFTEHVFSEAEEENAVVIPFSHHNLLGESRLYRENCTMENGRDAAELCEAYHVPLWFSGHLHAQRIRQHKEGPGIEAGSVSEVVQSCFAMYPFSYGELRFEDDGSISYQAENTRVPESISESGREEYLRVQKAHAEEEIRGIPKEMEEEAAEAYAELMSSYVSGSAVDAEEFLSSKGASIISKYFEDTKLREDAERILKDSGRDMRSIRVTAEDGSENGENPETDHIEADMEEDKEEP